MSEPIIFERKGAVGYLRLNRPEVLNAINPELCEALVRCIDEAEADSSIRAMVIGGSGPRAFCSGADLHAVKTLTGSAKRRFVEGAWLAFDRLAKSPVPSIAALHGYVLGGGLELAIACDMRIAEPGTTFGLPELSLGSVPAFGAIQRLPRLIGHSRATELALTGRRFGTEEAKSYGLLTAIAETGSAVPDALSLAGQLAERPREALRYLKLCLNAPIDGTVAAHLHGLVSEVCHADPDYQRQIRRYSRAT